MNRQKAMVSWFVIGLLAVSMHCDAASAMDSYLKARRDAQESALRLQQQILYQQYLQAETARIRAEEEALRKQQELQQEQLRLEAERQRQASEQAEATRRQIEAEQLRQQLVAKRAEIEIKLFDQAWRKAVDDTTTQQHLTLYNELSTTLGMPLLEKLPVLADPELNQEELVSKVTPALVLVRHRDCAGNWQSGTGFLVSNTGDLLTCAHVVTSDAKPKTKTKPLADKTWVRIPGGEGTEAQVIFINSKWDIALLRIDKQDTPYLDVAEQNPKQGESVFAFGYPLGDSLGKESVVTAGIVSAMRLGDSVFQLDAALNPGNSGGPVMNKQGSVAGIAWAHLRDYEGTNFAISSATIRKVLAGDAP